MDTLVFVRGKYLYVEIIKSLNSETNNKSPGNDDLTAEFYKYFPNKLANVLSDLYDSWGKFWHCHCYF